MRHLDEAASLHHTEAVFGTNHGVCATAAARVSFGGSTEGLTACLTCRTCCPHASFKNFEGEILADQPGVDGYLFPRVLKLYQG